MLRAGCQFQQGRKGAARTLGQFFLGQVECLATELEPLTKGNRGIEFIHPKLPVQRKLGE